jgi:SAM-dependent methyltransferase
LIEGTRRLQCTSAITVPHLPTAIKGPAKRILNYLNLRTKRAVLTAKGHCPCCLRTTVFRSFDPWLRDYFLCDHCGSIPRERALMWTINTFVPDWREKVIHESSPVNRGASVRLAQENRRYVASQFFPGVTTGKMVGDVRCENLEALSFPDNSIDLHVTQDVFEHIFNPEAAFREVARTLRPGGAHIFTTPLVQKAESSEICAAIESGKVIHFKTPEYHGNPISGEGSLVTMRWGYDICEKIFQASGLFTQLIYIDALELGIRAEFIEVLVTKKPLHSAGGATANRVELVRSAT